MVVNRLDWVFHCCLVTIGAITILYTLVSLVTSSSCRDCFYSHQAGIAGSLSAPTSWLICCVASLWMATRQRLDALIVVHTRAIQETIAMDYMILTLSMICPMGCGVLVVEIEQ